MFDKTIRRNEVTIWLTVILVTSFVIAYFPVWRTLVLTWYGSEQYSHGFLVVPIFIYILLTKKDKLSETPVQPSLWGLGLVILSSLLYLFAHFAEIVTVSSCSIVLLLIGIVVYLYGARMLKELAFPLFFLLFMIPIPSQIYATLTIPLQLFVSKASAWLAMLWGVPLYREGNIIHLPDRSMQIVQACSGLRSMASLLALSVLLAYFMLRSNLLRVALFLSGIPTAIIVNIVRVLLLVVVFHYCNLDLTARALHTVFGLFIFLLALLIMIAIRGILSHWDKRTIET